MCVTLSVGALEPMSQFMRYAQVTPYMYDVPKYYFKIAPYLEAVLNKKSLRRSERNFYTINDLTTLNGQRLTMFSKHKKFGKDLWYGLIAPFFSTNMAVESWRNGAAKDVGTTCGINENVYDVDKVKVLDAEFDNSMDHSKWGVSMHKNASIACVGGINRQYSQYKRGGGAVCIDNIRLWNTLLNSVDEYTGCGF
ncbi:hypothetical protein Q1695_007484 [Nippostrongylus brasiliensis]|nr:hypothetical protein Q1695_007484 [Nippostrongylus brasiliensis]